MATAERTWTLISPVAPPGKPERRRHTGPRPAVTTLGFLSNRKHNTDEMQRLLGERIAASHQRLRLQFYQKPNAAAGADRELLERIAKEVQVVINGTGD